MRCKEVEKLLAGYSDNSLNIADRDEIKKHLAKCVECADYLNAMTKIDNLIKLKAKERPSKEYFENYWPKLKGKLDRTVVPRLSEDGSLPNRFVPRLTLVFNGLLIALIIFLSGLLYINTQQIKTLQSIQEEMQQEMSKTVFHLITRANMEGNMPKFDKLEKL